MGEDVYKRQGLCFYPINKKKQGHWSEVPCKGELNMEDKKPKAKREYKDTVFRMLFSDKKNLLSLYNAVTGRAHENAEDFEIVTLDNAVDVYKRQLQCRHLPVERRRM